MEMVLNNGFCELTQDLMMEVDGGLDCDWYSVGMTLSTVAGGVIGGVIGSYVGPAGTVAGYKVGTVAGSLIGGAAGAIIYSVRG